MVMVWYFFNQTVLVSYCFNKTMKKAAALFFLFLFLFSNSGMAVSVHYCRGKITSIKFLGGDEHSCKCGKKAMKRSCCKDKAVVFKANTEPAKVNPFSFKILLPKFELAALHKTETVVVQVQHFCANLYHPPIFKPRTPIFLLDRVIRI